MQSPDRIILLVLFRCAIANAKQFKPDVSSNNVLDILTLASGSTKFCLLPIVIWHTGSSEIDTTIHFLGNGYYVLSLTYAVNAGKQERDVNKSVKKDQRSHCS